MHEPPTGVELVRQYSFHSAVKYSSPTCGQDLKNPPIVQCPIDHFQAASDKYMLECHLYHLQKKVKPKTVMLCGEVRHLCTDMRCPQLKCESRTSKKLYFVWKATKGECTEASCGSCRTLQELLLDQSKDWNIV